MADLAILYDEDAGTSTSSGSFVDTAVIPAASFVAGHEYVIIASCYLVLSGATSSLMSARLVHGATPTVFDDALCVLENLASGDCLPCGWLARFTQPGTTEDVKIQIGRTPGTSGTAAGRLSQILAIDLTDLTEDVDYFWDEITADDTSGAAYESGASVTLPAGDWAVFAHKAYDEASVANSENMAIGDGTNDQPEVIREGENTSELINYLLFKAVAPTGSTTYAARYKTESTARTVFSTRIFALRLAKFAQHAITSNMAAETPATTPSVTTTLTLSPTPDATGDWVYVGYLTYDIAATGNDMDVWFEVNPDGVGLVEDPVPSSGMPGPSGADPTDQVPVLIFKKRQLNSGAARDINFMTQNDVGTPDALHRSLAAFSVALASSAQYIRPTDDGSDGAWVNEAASQTNLYASIDETVASDSDYIESESGPANSVTRLKLNPSAGDPLSSTGHILRWRVGKNVTAGEQIDMTVRIYQGGGATPGAGTLIADFIRTNVDAATTFEETLSGGEADTITDYGDLWVEFEADQV